TEMALAVSYPFAGNLGGGGFMVYRKANGETGALDYREKAPLKASRNMYLDEEGNAVPERSQVGELAVGVPGTVAGIFAVHEKFGSLPMEQILEPVIALAQNGFVISENQQKTLEAYQEMFIKVNKDTILFAGNFSAGDTLRNVQLARTLERLAQNGKKEFYEGKTAEILVDYLKERGGIIS
ncbi:gamma-glutamyltransferase, partial [Longispora fulva]|uniref:gamma-glutamyltransferase n=2 Tax=Bacteria TaxID=2 RepID=UPI00363B9901